MTMSGGIRSYLKELGMGFGVPEEWKYIVSAIVITILMTAVLVVMLPDGPLEFW